MADTLRLYRAVVVETDDPMGLGRVKLAITRTVRGVTRSEQGWALVGITPLAPTVTASTAYAIDDQVLYAAERWPFAGAVVLCRTSTAS